MRSLTNTLRALALSAAIGIAMLAWQAGHAPPRLVLNADGSVMTFNGKPVARHGAFWVNLAILVISSLIQYALAPKPPKPKPAALEDFDIPQAQMGPPFAMIFGEVLDEAPTVGWYGALTNKPIKKGKK